ncbi:hypothetical protein GCM10007304_01030 [Rhodococcoides trifolii]|uniref:DUF664 domain-containing protein n=1 Tax=Rhodococcoides trifolii TaxID=908250 RepID=A0A917CM95_9NOCA|nr:hypothetical protein GCM10007304_01030 [Rhodococcus trifolii]
MYAVAGESREQILDGYRAAWAHSDRTIVELDLDTSGHVPHWPQERAAITLHRTLIHVTAETARHAGQADIVRETIDGVAGLRAVGDNLGDVEAGYLEKLEAIAREFGPTP